MTKTTIAALALVLGISISHARDWGFTRDTLYDWSGTGDSVYMANQGADTLRLDSIALEILTPGKSMVEVEFVIAGQAANQYRVRYRSDSLTYPFTHPGMLLIAPTDSIRMMEFRIDAAFEHPPTGEWGTGSDTLSARLIFIAAQSGERDTLIVTGIDSYNPSSSLRSLRPDAGPGSHAGRAYDLRGRRLEAVSEGRRAPATPVMTPRE